MTDFGPVISSDDFNRGDASLRSLPDFSYERLPGERLSWILDPQHDTQIRLEDDQLVILGDAVAHVPAPIPHGDVPVELTNTTWNHQFYGWVESDSPPADIYRTDAAHSVLLNANSGDNYGYWWLDLQDTNGYILTTGTLYRATAWIRGVSYYEDPARTATFRTESTTMMADVPYTTDSWTELTGTFIEDGTGRIRIDASSNVYLGGVPDWGVYVSDWQIAEIT